MFESISKRSQFTLLFMIVAFVTFSVLNFHSQRWYIIINNKPCPDNCKITLVESIPENLTFVEGSPVFPSTFTAWQTLLDETQESLDMAVFYWSLTNEDVTPVKMPSAWQGETIFQHLKDIGSSGNVHIRVAQNAPNHRFPQNNSRELAELGSVEVRSLDFDQLMGGGVLHTKLWISDDKSFYLGSANMDWQSLTQVKEVGVLVQNCSCLAKDMKKVFEVYWALGNNVSKIPPSWPDNLQTPYNMFTPMTVSLSGHESKTYISSSPLPFNPMGRTNDINAIISIIRAADKFVYIAVMDYFPLLIYGKKKFWPYIDNELRRAAVDKKVQVRLLASHWNHTRPELVRFMKSLQDVSGASVHIETKLFTVPSYTDLQRQLPFARVNHNKYMVTDKTAYIGTSNWSGDYFTKTGGISLSVSNETKGDSPTLRSQLESVFIRDWTSEYAKPIEDIVAS